MKVFEQLMMIPLTLRKKIIVNYIYFLYQKENNSNK